MRCGRGSRCTTCATCDLPSTDNRGSPVDLTFTVVLVCAVGIPRKPFLQLVPLRVEFPSIHSSSVCPPFRHFDCATHTHTHTHTRTHTHDNTITQRTQVVLYILHVLLQYWKQRTLKHCPALRSGGITYVQVPCYCAPLAWWSSPSQDGEWCQCGLSSGAHTSQSELTHLARICSRTAESVNTRNWR